MITIVNEFHNIFKNAILFCPLKNKEQSYVTLLQILLQILKYSI